MSQIPHGFGMVFRRKFAPEILGDIRKCVEYTLIIISTEDEMIGT
tara:strand:+ start:198 stop:332 length:135 start_codon:yes stop_codon:yes gene_type:complete